MKMKRFVLLIFILAWDVPLIAGEIKFDFNSDANVTYNPQAVEIYKGKLKLSVTGWWTNTGHPPLARIPSILFQDSKGNIFFSARDVTGNCYLYKSDDYGTNWTSVLTYLIGFTIDPIIEVSDGNLYCYGKTTYKSYDNGDNWTNILPYYSSEGTIFEDSNHCLLLFKKFWSPFFKAI